MATPAEFPALFRLHPFGSSKSDHICIDLLLLILKCFPIQTLLICRSVCKFWKQIIDSTSFISDHLAHQTPRILLQNSLQFLLLDPKNPPIYDTVTAPDGIDFAGSQPSRLQAVSTIHGVVCLYDNGNNLFLWNPSIRRHRRIPLPSFESSACGNTDWYKYCGFWMDSCAKEFKVVIFYIGAHEKGGCFFSSRNQYWLEIPEDEMTDYDGDYVTVWQSPQVMIDGVAYWIAANRHEYYGGLIVTYDFEQGKFGKMSLPEIVSCWGLIIYVSKWDDYLSIVVSEGYPVDSPEFELWVLKNGSWTKMMMFFPMIGVGRVFCALDRFTILAATEEELLILYDAEDGSFTHLRSRKEESGPLNWHCGDANSLSFGYDFVESFVFPDRKCISSVE